MKMLATKQVPLEELSPYPDNARNGDTDAIAASLDAHDQYRAIVVWASDGEGGTPMQVLAGNHTYFASGERGRKRMLCHLIECDADEARRINIADNRLPELGGYDTAQLVENLQALEGDFTGTGYDQDGLDALLKQLDQEAGAPIEESTRCCPSCGHVAPASKFKSED